MTRVFLPTTKGKKEEGAWERGWTVSKWWPPKSLQTDKETLKYYVLELAFKRPIVAQMKGNISPVCFLRSERLNSQSFR